jgi:leucine-zipper of insertion element IS481
MDIHQNARLTPHGRAELVRRVLVMGQAPKAVAGALGVTVCEGVFHAASQHVRVFSQLR